MKAIWKFQLSEGVTEIEAPVVKFLTVQLQAGTPCVWAIVDTDRRPNKFNVSLVGTGWAPTQLVVSLESTSSPYYE